MHLPSQISLRALRRRWTDAPNAGDGRLSRSVVLDSRLKQLARRGATSASAMFCARSACAFESLVVTRGRRGIAGIACPGALADALQLPLPDMGLRGGRRLVACYMVSVLVCSL